METITFESVKAKMLPMSKLRVDYINSVIQPCDDIWIAGGFVRDLLSKQDSTTDVDVYFHSQNKLNATIKQLKSHKDLIRYHEGKNSDRCWINGIEFNIIKYRTYKSLEEVLDSFDYTICQFGWNGSNIYYTKEALRDLAGNRLILHKCTFATSSVRRMIKYAEKGFTICPKTISGILKEVATDPKIIHEEMNYID